MCQEVKINGKWCSTEEELRRELPPGCEIVKDARYTECTCVCLCHVDLPETLQRAGIRYREDYGEFICEDAACP